MTQEHAPSPELLALFRAQQAHRERMARTTPDERRAILRAFRDALNARREDIVAALASDLGKSRHEALLTEIMQVQDELTHAISQVGRWMKPRQAPPALTLPGLRGEVRPEPKGTVLILGPWNYPLTNLLTPFVDALAAGNTVILKPSELAPATARVIRDIVEATFEPHLVAVVEGGPDVAQQLTHLPFDHILFTGSTEVGRKVMQAAATNLTPVTLELGGKSPVVIHRSADLERTAERLVWGKLMNVGQTCIAPDYALVPREMQADLAAHLTAAVKKMYGEGDWLRQNADLGRMISSDAVARLRAAVEGSVQRGARVVVGGEFDEAARFIAPTIVSDVTRSMPLMERELFGPVLPLLPYDDLDAEIGRINAGPTPLALYIFAEDKAAAEDILNRTRSGGATVNGTMMHISYAGLPFGGRGHSGMGRYHGFYGFQTFSHERGVVYEPALTPVGLLRAPFDRLLTRTVLGVMTRPLKG